MELQKILYENFLKSLGNEWIEVKEEERKAGEIGQARLFFMTPPEYAVIIKKEEDLNVIVPLTSYIPLAITDRLPPVVKWRKYNLVPLPFFVYVNEKLLQKYSIPMFYIRDENGLNMVKEYVKNAKVKGIGKWREKFIRKNWERWKDLNLSSIIYEIVKEEVAEGLGSPQPQPRRE